MEKFWSFDEVMELGYASKIEQMEVFQEIKEKEVEMVEQVSGGHVMVEEGHQICVASSSCKSGFLYAFSLFDLCRKQEDQQNYATHVS